MDPKDSTQGAFRWRSIAVAAFGPSLLFSIAEGAILPVIALSARADGASEAVAGLIVTLVGVGSLVSNIPAALIIARFGERAAMIGASALSVAALAMCLVPRALAVFAAGVFVLGAASSVLLLARQTYLIEAVPPDRRARAMSSLGGTRRIGVFVGPFIGAAAMYFIGLSGAYAVGIAFLVGCAMLVWCVPELDTRTAERSEGAPAPRLRDVFWAHRKSYCTLGLGVLLVKGLRSSRQIVIPLWAAHLGIDPVMTSVIYGLVACIDMLAFYPAGYAMDRCGRAWVAIPSVVIMGTAMMVEPLTVGFTSFLLVSMTLGLGNGVGSGLVMTLGADASPRVGRTQFLGVWRLFADIGGSATPGLLSLIAGVASLAAGMTAVGALGFVAAAVFWRWLPHGRSLSASGPPT